MADDGAVVESERSALLSLLERQYRQSGWSSRRGDNDVIRAVGPGGVTWFGMAILPQDLADRGLVGRIRELADQRMPRGGELCVLDLLPSAECHDEVDRLLDAAGLGSRNNISLYALPAAVGA